VLANRGIERNPMFLDGAGREGEAAGDWYEAELEVGIGFVMTVQHADHPPGPDAEVRNIALGE
jgi:hypothetical protein